MTSARVHPFRAGLSRYYSAWARRHDPLERVRNARDALPQRARTVRVGSDARDRPPYWCATWPAIWCWKEQKERHCRPTFTTAFQSMTRRRTCDMSRSILRSIQIQSASASREGCRGRSCDHSLAQVGRLERRKLAWTQSATSLHSLVRWSSPSKVTEPRHVPSGNRRRLVAESFPVTARAAAVRASERCWSLTLAFAQGWLQPRLHPPPASRTLSV